MIYDDFKINIYNLHREWEQQPSLSFKYGEDLAFKKAERDRKKGAMDLALADAIDHVLSNPDEYDMTKAQANSSTFVKNKALSDEAYQTAYEEWVKAEREANKVQAACWSLVDKKMALESITKLFLADYYTTDTVTPDARIEAIDRKDFKEQQLKALRESKRMRRRVKNDIKDEKPEGS